VSIPLPTRLAWSRTGAVQRLLPKPGLRFKRLIAALMRAFCFTGGGQKAAAPDAPVPIPPAAAGP
jgi:hypothetical protein